MFKNCTFPPSVYVFFVTLQPVITKTMWSTLLSVILIINELMASNAGEVMSPATNFDSWIELYNPSDEDVSLNGMYLSNDPENLTLWKMPNGIGTVPAKGFKVVWLGSNDLKNTQAPFKLDCDGGTIFLSDKSGNLIASQDYPEAMSRTSYARRNDGGDEWGWTATATPGATNATSQFADIRLPAPVVDQGSQLFKGSLKIQVDIPEGTTLLYTTDGSVPSTSNASSKQSTDGQFFARGTTNFVFRLFKDGYLPSVPVTRSYIQTKDNYTIPIISIVGNEKYFTDPMWGIDVKGINGITGNCVDEPCNWNMDWDRPVNFSYISPTEGMLFNQDVNIAVSGGCTRVIEPRSMKLKSNKIFDGQNHFDYSFFPQKPYIRNKVLVVRNGGNDAFENHARFMDPALTTIVQRSGIDLDVQSTVQVAEFINGRFRGVLNLREPNNDKFVYANYGYDDDEIDMFENDIVKNGTYTSFKQLCQFSAGINYPGIYDAIKKQLDIDEFTNYMATEIFLCNDDWPINNVKAYRNQNDGRYRFILFDLDYSLYPWAMKSDLSEVLDKNMSVDVVRLFLNLLKHDEYRRKFIDTFCIVAGSVFEKKRATAIVDELAAAMRPMSELDGHVPDKTADMIKRKLKTQMVHMTNLLQRYKPLELTDATKLSVSLTTDTDRAGLYINGLHVPYASFDGQLFAPVTIEVKAPAGYDFIGWKTSVGSKEFVSTDPVMNLSEDHNRLSLIACFTPREQTANNITPIRINEVSASNGIYVNEYFKRNDWVELYNTTNAPIDVEGMYLTDKESNPKKYQITKGETQATTVIPAHGYLIVWCDKLEPTTQLHADFKLADEGGIVMLTAADESWSDLLTYTEHQEEQTVGRYPDGTSDVFVMNIPTIAKPNITSSYLTAVSQPQETGIRDLMADVAEDVSINYHQGSLVISSTFADNFQFKIINLSGQTVMNAPVLLTGDYTEVNVEQLPAGIYIANITGQHGQKASCKIVVNTTPVLSYRGSPQR